MDIFTYGTNVMVGTTAGAMGQIKAVCNEWIGYVDTEYLQNNGSRACGKKES